MAEKKMTYSEAIDKAMALEGITEDVKERLADLKEALAKRNGSKKENADTEPIKNAILDILADGEKYTITDLISTGRLPEVVKTPQKVSPAMSKLVEAGVVVSEMEKGKKVFSLA